MSASDPALLTTELPTSFPVRRGKVRDIYEIDGQLLMVSTDRISAFDWVLPSGIPDKGRVLTQISAFWFEHLAVPNHLLTMELDGLDLPDNVDLEALTGRSMVVRQCEVAPIECVVRGYLEGSGWREYQATGSVCGIRLPTGLKQCDQLPEPIFTPATKEESGHDVNISFEEMCNVVGQSTAIQLKDKSMDLYVRGSEHAKSKGILIADTKFEWGLFDNELILIDEVLTPDSSRFWPADRYEPGHSQPSFDKQFVREYLDSTDWDKNSEPPALPDDIIQRTREKYIEAYERLTGLGFPWR